jgi:high-affinity iron transporter
MLINSVILFLRDALPIFVLAVYLYLHLPKNKTWLIMSLLAGSLLSLTYISHIHVVSQWFGGKGIELSMWLCQLFVYLFSLLLGYSLSRKAAANKAVLYWLAGLMLALTLLSKGGNFILYFEGYLGQNNLLQSMLLGTFLGLGICLSLAILLYLATQWLKQSLGPWATWSLLHIYATGQLVNALPLLVQVDLIDESATAWNSQHLVSNELEFGHLFNVLFGYQATPSIDQVIIYLFALLIPLAIFYWFIQRSASDLGNKQ